MLDGLCKYPRMKTIMILLLGLGLVGCDDKAAGDAPAEEHELEVVKCKAGTEAACDELVKLCTDGKSSACAALTRAGKSAPSAAPVSSGTP